MQLKFTLTNLKGLEVNPERNELYWDTDLRGFGLRISRGGTKSWVIQYDAPNGKRRRLTIGRADDRLPLRQAKKLAAEKLRAVAVGKDPAEAKKARREAATLKDLEERVYEEHALKKSKSTQYMYKESFEAIHEILGTRTVKSIRWEDVAKLHTALGDTPYKANRILAVVSKSFKLAKKWEWYPRHYANPAEDHERYPEKPRGQVLTTEQTSRIGQAMEAEEVFQRAALECLMLTGCRPKEILRAKKEDLVSNGRVLRLKEAKTGPRLVFLGRPTTKLIQDLPDIAENPYIFPGQNPGKPLHDLRGPWQRVKARAELPDSVRMYDAVRHSFISKARGLGISEKVAKLLAGHAPGREAHDRYVHPLAADDSLTDWGRHLLSKADLVSTAIQRDLEGL